MPRATRPVVWPRQWLFTDERLGTGAPGDRLWAAIRRLPRGAGIVFRHYSLAPAPRRALAHRIRAVARARGLMLMLANPPPGLRADGIHRPAGTRAPARGQPVTAAAHNRRELARAFSDGAGLVFLSPIFSTASHPGAPTHGPVRFGLMARGSNGPVVALGGMSSAHASRLKPLGAYGYAAIDAWA